MQYEQRLERLGAERSGVDGEDALAAELALGAEDGYREECTISDSTNVHLP